MFRKHFPLAYLAFFCGTSLVAQELSSDPSSVPIKYTSLALIKKRKSGAIPQYPEKSLKARSEGMVAITIKITPEGKVDSVSTYIFPDDAIAKEVTETIGKWSFYPAKIGGVAHPAIGKLILYYKCEGNTGRVVVPGLDSEGK